MGVYVVGWWVRLRQCIPSAFWSVLLHISANHFFRCHCLLTGSILIIGSFFSPHFPEKKEASLSSLSTHKAWDVLECYSKTPGIAPPRGLKAIRIYHGEVPEEAFALLFNWSPLLCMLLHRDRTGAGSISMGEGLTVGTGVLNWGTLLREKKGDALRKM